MRIRTAAATVMAIAALSACSSNSNGHGSGGSGSSTAPSGAPTSTSNASTGNASTSSNATASTGTASAFCTKLLQASGKLSGLGGDISDPSKLKSAVAVEISYFQDLKNSAPAEIQPPIADLISVLGEVRTALENPSSANASALENLAKKVPADSEKLGQYAASHCTGG